jgi:hypothetical protein
MIRTAPTIEVRKASRGYAIFAGASMLGHGFKTRDKAERWAQENASFLAYWAGSVGVSLENSECRVINA